MGRRRGLAFVAAAALVVAACSGGGGDGGDGDDGAASATPPATRVGDDAGNDAETDDADPDDADRDDVDPSTSVAETEPSGTARSDGDPPVEVVSYDVPVDEPADPVLHADGTESAAPLPPQSPEHLVRIGVDAGVWTEAEGVIAILRHLSGEAPRDAIGGLERVVSRSYTGVAELAREFLDDEALPADERDELERLLRAVAPPIEVLEALSEPDDTSDDPATTSGENGAGSGDDEQSLGVEPAGGGTAGAVPVSRAIPAQSSGCVAVQEDGFAELDVGENCWKVRTRSTGLGGYRLRVFYPPEWEGEAQEPIVNAALDALELTNNSFDQWGDVRDISLAFSFSDNDDEDLGLQMPAGPDECAITIFPAVTTNPANDFAEFRQLVAHEAVHCVQDVQLSGEPAGWIIEGGAEYFSHWLINDGGLEQGYIGTFDASSLNTPLQDLDYAAWPWWQFLANQSGPASVWEIHKQLAGGASLASIDGMDDRFQQFAVEWTGPGVTDSNGASMPGDEPAVNDTRVVDETGDQEITTSPWVLTRLRLDYEKERRFVQSDQSEGQGAYAMARWADRGDLGAWKQIPPEIRSTCDEREPYIVVVTTGADQHRFRATVDEVEEAECDPCLFGTWAMDLSTFEAFLDDMMASQGAPAGASIELSGKYLITFDDESQIHGWRDGFTITVSTQGHSFPTVVDAIEMGEYSADGETLDVRGMVQTAWRGRSDVGPISVEVSESGGSVSFLGQTYATPGVAGEDGPQSAEAPYRCDEQQLEIDVPEVGTVRFDRVEEIPDPPDTIPPA